MKKTICKVISMLLTAAMVCMMCALTVTADHNKSYGDVPKTSNNEIVIDGMMEEMYEKGTQVPITRIGGGKQNTPLDGIAYFLYDDSNLYVCVTINDPSYDISFYDTYHFCEQCGCQLTFIDKANQAKPTCAHVTADNADKRNLWDDDCVELFVDWENDGIGMPSQYRVSRSGIASRDWYIRDNGFYADSSDTGEQWTAEFAIPLDTSASGTQLGIDIMIHSQGSFSPYQEKFVYAQNSLGYGSSWQSQYYDYIVLGSSFVNHGTCGDNLTWAMEDSSTLTISGTGEMWSYENKNVPWLRSSIKTVKISDGVTSIGDNAFYNCPLLTNITIPDSVKSIGNYAFYNCQSITDLRIPKNVTKIGVDAFIDCKSMIIHGYIGSAAQMAATRCAVPFVAIKDVTELFTDVKPDAWYVSAVQYAAEHELFNGVSENKFAPDSDMNRAMLVTVLWRMEEKPTVSAANPFSDVPANEYYTDAVLWASSNEIVNGIGDGKFAPMGNITREQMATILYRYAQKKGYNTTARADISSFPDGTRTSPYAKDALSWAYAENLINGSDGKLLPQGNATRAQVAAILMRYGQNIVQDH